MLQVEPARYMWVKCKKPQAEMKQNHGLFESE